MKATNAAELDFSEYIAERTLHFTGREWLFREIDDWLDAVSHTHLTLPTIYSV